MNIYKTIFSLIPKNFRIRSLVVLILVFIGMILETLGVGLIIPVFSLILDVNKLSEYSFFQSIISTFAITNNNYLVYFSLGILIFIYIIKAFYLSILAWVQARFVYDLQADISRNLFSTYIKKPYSFHLKKNSAYLLRNVTTEAQQLTEAAFLSMMLIINEVIVIFGLVMLMFFLTPQKALILFSIVLIGGFTIQMLTKNLLVNWGAKRQLSDGLKIKAAQEGLGGIKDIKVLGRESEILERFYTHVNIASTASANRNAVQQYPRIWIEFLGIISLMIIVLVDLISGTSPIDIIPGVAFIAAIAFRIMPSANRFLSAIQSLKFSTPVVQLFKDELDLNNDSIILSDHEPLKFEESIKLNNLTFSYNQKEIILNNISLEVFKGKKIGIVGSSGAGKSTFVDLLLGLHHPSEGNIEVDGSNIFENIGGWHEILGYVPQTIFLSDDTLRRNIAFGLSDSQIDDNNISYAIKLSQLDNFVKQLDDGVETVLGERGVRISGGQRQRIGIARALYRKPKLLILDEATSALDNDIEKDVMNSIYSLDTSITILIIAHRLSTLEGCDKIITLANGIIQD